LLKTIVTPSARKKITTNQAELRFRSNLKESAR